MHAPAPSSPATFARTLAARLETGQRVLLTGPMDPDGDSIGARIAPRSAWKGVTGADVVVAGEPGPRYSWMPRAAEMVRDDALEGPWELVIVLDGDRFRLDPGADAAFHTARCRGIVDHHRSTTLEGYDIALVQADAASTCQLVHGILETWGVPMDRDLAALLYTGLVFDTGGFRHSNTTPTIHRLAATLLEHDIDHSAIALRVLAERDPAGPAARGCHRTHHLPRWRPGIGRQHPPGDHATPGRQQPGHRRHRGYAAAYPWCRGSAS